MWQGEGESFAMNILLCLGKSCNSFEPQLTYEMALYFIIVEKNIWDKSYKVNHKVHDTYMLKR